MSAVVRPCGFPLGCLIFQSSYMMTLVILFLNFYIQVCLNSNSQQRNMRLSTSALCFYQLNVMGAQACWSAQITELHRVHPATCIPNSSPCTSSTGELTPVTGLAGILPNVFQCMPMKFHQKYYVFESCIYPRLPKSYLWKLNTVYSNTDPGNLCEGRKTWTKWT